MSATSPVFAVGVLAVAIVTAWVLGRSVITPPVRRFGSVEGLRGYLALLVFTHHAANWRLFARTGVWTLPPSRLYIHFGQSSVALFFMITAFLFGSKLLESHERPIDWRRLYVSRVLRLVPLNVAAVALLWMLALIGSHFVLRVSIWRAGLDTLHWLAFTMVAMPDLNGFPASVVGGAAWSLPYEWWFYFSLPLLGLVVGLRRSWQIIAASAGTMVVMCYWVSAHHGWPVAAEFLGGFVAAALARYPRAREIARHPIATLVCLTALGAATRTLTAFEADATAWLTLAFVIIACGNTLFGLLQSKPSRILGEMSYSLYLLHGIVLFCAFASIGNTVVAEFSAVQHWLVVYLCVPVLVGLCHITFRRIEAPAMAAVDRVTVRLRAAEEPSRMRAG